MLAPKHRWLLLFTVAFALRATYLLGGPLPIETRQTPIVADAAGYSASALVLLGGSTEPGESSVPREVIRGKPWTLEDARTMLVSRGPGYVLFLASLFRLICVDAWVVRWAQTLLGALACVLIALAGRELASQRVGLVAGGLAALHPTLILFSGRMMPEILGLFLFCLGFFILIRAHRRGETKGLLAAGLIIALAMLTRPTLFVVVPFLWVGIAIATAISIPGNRSRRLAAFTIALLAPLMIWNEISQSLGAGQPTAGRFGLRVAAHLFLSATSPDLRGWRADTTAYVPQAELHFDQLGYRAVAVLDLLFYHAWFLDNVWNEVRNWMHDLQRIMFVLALGGLGLAVVQWRRLVPLLAIAMSTVVVTAKYVEIRPVISLIPVQLLLVGVLVDEVWKSIGARARPTSAFAPLVSGTAVVIGLVYIHQPAELACLLPFLDAVALGHAGDLVVCIASLLAGGVLHGLMRPRYGARAAAVAGGVPAVSFVLLFLAHAFVASGPRWRAWELDLNQLGGAAQTRISLRDPLPGARIRTALAFLDLRSEVAPPPVRIGIDETWLPRDPSTWQRFHCNPNDGFRETPVEEGRCYWYRTGISDFTGTFSGSPQWWFARIPTALVAGRRQISLSFAADAGGAAENGVSIGGTLGREAPGTFYGPVLRVAGSSPATSIFRWTVEGDWRFWSVQPLASLATQTAIPFPSEDASGRAARMQRLVANAAAGRRAQLNARLMVEYDDGRRVIY